MKITCNLFLKQSRVRNCSEMKSLVFIIAVIVVSVVRANFIKKTWDSKIATKDDLFNQVVIYDLLNHVIQQNWHQEQTREWKDSIDFLQQNAHNYNKTSLVQYYMSLQPVLQNKIYSHLNQIHYMQTSALFDLLYYSKDFKTFCKTARWARDNVNIGVFIQAFITAFFHRQDCRSLTLPPLFEIYPFSFVQSDVQTYVSQIKEQGSYDNLIQGRGFGIDVGKYNNYTINNSFKGVFKHDSEDAKLVYFTQDAGLNMYNYLYFTEYPSYLNKEEYGLSKKVRGEIFFYMYQQLIARYQLERLSNKLGKIDIKDFTKPAYSPNMRYHNGFAFPTRPEKFDVSIDENIKLIEKYTQFEEMTHNHMKKFNYFLDKEEALKEVGHMYLSHEEPYLFKKAYGGSFFKNDLFSYVPSALEKPETSMRDPAFYKIHQMFLKKYLEVKRSLPPYIEELSFPGVKVENLEHSQLTTYIEPYKFDITNLVYLNKEERNNSKESLTFECRQERLNHKSFSFILQVSSEQQVNAAVRIFLGPKYDHNGHSLMLNESRNDFIQLDSFMYSLKPGKNFIIRKDHEFARTSIDPIPTRTMLKKIKEALNGGEPFEISETKPRNNWPTNLLLPKGQIDGFELKLYIIVTKFKKWEIDSTDISEFRNIIGITNSVLAYDNLPYGFPFDREINENMLRIPNVLAFDIKIFHD